MESFNDNDEYSYSSFISEVENDVSLGVIPPPSGIKIEKDESNPIPLQNDEDLTTRELDFNITEKYIETGEFKDVSIVLNESIQSDITQNKISNLDATKQIQFELKCIIEELELVCNEHHENKISLKKSKNDKENTLKNKDSETQVHLDLEALTLEECIMEKPNFAVIRGCIKMARGLKVGATMHSYIKVFLISGNNHSIHIKRLLHRTEEQCSTNPCWKSSFVSYFSDNEIVQKSLLICVNNKNSTEKFGGSPKLVGQCHVKLADLLMREKVSKWVPLYSIDRCRSIHRYGINTTKTLDL